MKQKVANNPLPVSFAPVHWKMHSVGLYYQQTISSFKFIIMKKTAFLFWTTTIVIFLFEGVVPALTSPTELAKEGIKHLGYPAYFGIMLTVFKILGALALVLPRVPDRIKEWAYAGFAFDFIAACISHAVIDGAGFQTFFPLIFLILLFTSYVNYHRRMQYASLEKPQPENMNVSFVA